jgi:DNA-directed RNA polymerase specialized sigma24 family protein
MKIPNDFREALERAYRNAGELNNLFINHKTFIMRIVMHQFKYRHWSLISDEDDLYQEACIWLVNSLWEWDEERNTPLAEYVAYNIGVRLRNHMSKEQRQKRHPTERPLSLYRNTSNQDAGPGEKNSSTQTMEDKIAGDTPDPEALLIIRRVYKRVEEELPLMARELLESLMLESGNLSAASRRVFYNRRVRRVEGMTEDAFRQALRRNFLNQLRTVLIDEDIMPVFDEHL